MTATICNRHYALKLTVALCPKKKMHALSRKITGARVAQMRTRAKKIIIGTRVDTTLPRTTARARPPTLWCTYVTGARAISRPPADTCGQDGRTSPDVDEMYALSKH